MSSYLAKTLQYNEILTILGFSMGLFLSRIYRKNTQSFHRKPRNATKYCLPFDYVYRKIFIICAMSAIMMIIHKNHFISFDIFLHQARIIYETS